MGEAFQTGVFIFSFQGGGGGGGPATATATLRLGNNRLAFLRILPFCGSDLEIDSICLVFIEFFLSIGSSNRRRRRQRCGLVTIDWLFFEFFPYVAQIWKSIPFVWYL